MRVGYGIAAAVALTLVPGFVTATAEASCAGAAQIATRGPTGQSGIWTAGMFTPHYYPGYLPYDDSVPVTPLLVGAFWSLGTGDPVVGIGDDNGSFDVAQWFSYHGPDPFYGYYDAGEIAVAWNADPAIDGCIANGGPTPGFDDVECVAVLLGDVFGERGHYAVITRKVDSGLNAYLNQSGDAGIVLTPIDDPVIQFATGFPHPNEPKLDVTLASPSTAGGYLDPACGANIVVGYRVWVRHVAGGGNPPVGRALGDWNAPTGGPQLFPLGSPATVTVDLREFPPEDLYFAYSLVFDSGFETAYVSGNSPRIACNSCWIDGDDDGWAGVLPFSSAGDPAMLDTDPGPDCDDGAAAVFPGAVQLCDGINNDCSDPGWPGLAGTNEEDLDADAFSLCTGDCDDGANDVFPGAPELCDGRDNDCNALIDDDADGSDSDGDLVPNACDNCRFEQNAAQADLDSDAEGDLCDLDDGRIYVRHPATDGISWQQESGFSGWNVYRGDLDVLKGGGPYTQVPGTNELAERFCGLSATDLDDTIRPTSGKAAFYLVSGTAGPVESDLGTNGEGATRANVHPCP